MFITFLFALLSLSTLGLATPLNINARDVWDPRVTCPHAGTTWIVGRHYNVTWDTSNPPKIITDNKGEVVLSNNGMLDYLYPLVQGFDISKGYVEVKVPNVEPGSHYTVIVFGDSGNSSPPFTIKSA